MFSHSQSFLHFDLTSASSDGRSAASAASAPVKAGGPYAQAVLAARRDKARLLAERKAARDAAFAAERKAAENDLLNSW